MENTILRPLSAENANILSEIDIFKNLVKRASSLINKHGYNSKPYSPEALEKLTTLSFLEIKNCNSRLIDNLQLMEGSLSPTVKTSNKTLVRNITALMKLCVNDNFINQITDDDIVEIYNPLGVQMFRNLKFYETTAYSLADLLIFEWQELYSRPLKVYAKLAEYVDYCVNKAHNNEVINLKHLSSHIIKEIRSHPINLLEVKFLNIAPITNFGGSNAGLIVTCKAKNMLSLADEKISFI